MRVVECVCVFIDNVYRDVVVIDVCALALMSYDRLLVNVGGLATLVVFLPCHLGTQIC